MRTAKNLSFGVLVTLCAMVLSTTILADESWYRLDPPDCDVQKVRDDCWEQGPGWEELCEAWCGTGVCANKCASVEATGECEGFVNAGSSDPSFTAAYGSCDAGEAKCACTCECLFIG